MYHKVNEDVVTKGKQNKMSKKHQTYDQNTLNKIFTKTYISKKQNTQNKTKQNNNIKNIKCHGLYFRYNKM